MQDDAFATPAPADFLDRIDPDCQKVLRRLGQFDYHGYLVGGGVRDLLLDRTPKDFDVATSARPVEVRKLFRNCRLIGRRFRLAHILFAGGKIIELATFRAKPRVADDGALITDDNEFGSPESDAHRRDFTINALFYDPETDTVIDYVEGLKDLDARLLRTIGEPVVRFREDPIRMLRAVKFAARLDFDFEPATRAAILSERWDLEKAAVPRLLEELFRLMKGGASRRSMELLDELGMLEILVPEVAAFLGRPSEAPWAPLNAILDALDGQINAGETFENGFMVAALFWPLYRATLRTMPRKLQSKHLRPIAERIVAPMGVRLRMPRRDLATIIDILEGQVRFTSGRGRRSGRSTYARTPGFHAALKFLELRALAEPISPQMLEEWRELAAAYPPQPRRDDDERRRPRRRRRDRGFDDERPPRRR
jgi:poly(A) polymerase